MQRRLDIGLILTPTVGASAVPSTERDSAGIRILRLNLQPCICQVSCRAPRTHRTSTYNFHVHRCHHLCCQFLTTVIKALACSSKDVAINSRVVAALVGPTLSSCFSLRGVGDLLRPPSAVSVRSCSWRSLHKGKREKVWDLRFLAPTKGRFGREGIKRR